MAVNLNSIRYNIKELDKFNDGIKYQIDVFVPMSLGWIERMKFITETSNQRVAHQLHHVKNENGFVYFSENVFLPTKAIYHYYFSFEANHEFIYLKKNNQENYQTVSRDDMWKMSVNYNVPSWAKGKIMYHIFVDRYKRGSLEPLKEMPNRSIHKS